MRAGLLVRGLTFLFFLGGGAYYRNFTVPDFRPNRPENHTRMIVCGIYPPGLFSVVLISGKSNFCTGDATPTTENKRTYKLHKMMDTKEPFMRYNRSQD